MGTSRAGGRRSTPQVSAASPGSPALPQGRTLADLVDGPGQGRGIRGEGTWLPQALIWPPPLSTGSPYCPASAVGTQAHCPLCCSPWLFGPQGQVLSHLPPREYPGQTCFL